MVGPVIFFSNNDYVLSYKSLGEPEKWYINL